MANDGHLRKGRCAARILLHHPRQVRDWCYVLGCGEQELREGIAAVGNDVAAVRRWLMQRGAR